MKELPSADDFFNPQTPQTDKTAELPTADEFFAPPQPSSFNLAKNAVSSIVTSKGISSPAVDEFMQKTPAGRIMGAFGTGFAEGGQGGALGIQPGSDVESALTKAGIFNDYSKGQNDILKGANEAFIRPAAVALDTEFRGAQAAMGAIGGGLLQTAHEVGTAIEGNKTTPLIEQFAEYGLMHKAEIPHEITQARSVGAIGESESSYFGLKEPTPEQSVAREQAATQVEAVRPPEPVVPEVKDIHATAREIAPETFAKYDALDSQKDTLRTQLEDLRTKRDEEFGVTPPHADEIQTVNTQIEDLLDKVNGVEDRLTKRQASKLEDLRSQYDDLSEKSQTVAQQDTPEMATLRSQMAQLDYAKRDMAADVSAAYREAQSRIPQEEIKASESIPENETANPEIKNENPEIAQRPIEQQLQTIRDDVTEKLKAAGRPEEEATAASQLIAEHYKSVAEQGWAKGTPEEIYKRDGANIVAGKEKVRKGAREFAQDEKPLKTDTAAFKKWFGESKVKDAEGKPLVVYHGTNADIKAFGSDFTETMQLKGAGHYFTPDAEYASKFASRPNRTGGNVVPAYLKLENPLIVGPEELIKLRAEHGIGKPLTEYLKSQGHDGVIFNDPINKRQELVAFKPEQVKSVHNRGTFETENPNILEQKARGKIRLATDDAKAAITLFKTADASTFIHETGHAWLDEMMRYAKADDVPAGLLKDKDTVNKWLGVKEGEEITRTQHEKFARGFERYLMEGTAPSKELASVFAKFKKWLTDIYQTVQRLKSPITDDIRHVFDRLLSANPERTVIAPERDLPKALEATKSQELSGSERASVTNASTQATSPSIIPTKIPERSKAPKEKAIPPEKVPHSILEYISKRGGVVDEHGDLKAMGANDWHKGKPGVGKLIKATGSRLDDMALELQEKGYFPEKPLENGERVTINDLHEKIRQELQETKQYPDNFIKNAAIDPEYFNYLAENASQEEMERLNFDILDYHEAEYAKYEQQEKEWMESRGEAWEPAPETTANLEDLENERRQENATSQTQASAGNAEQSGRTPEAQAGGAESIQQYGSGTESTGLNVEEEQRNIANNPNARLGKPESKFVDKAGNIRLDNLNTPEDINAVIKETANQNDNFMGARRGVISDGQVLDLADALGMNPEELSKRRLGQAYNAEQIIAARKLLIQSAETVRNLGAKAAEGEESDLMAYAEARARHITIQEQVSGITAEAGRALRAFQQLEGGAEAKAVGEFLKENTGLDLFQLQQEAKQLSLLDTTQKVSKLINDANKPTYKNMILEYYINALISGPVTHLRYSVGNALNALWTPLVEVPTAAGIGRLREAITGEVNPNRVYLGEAGAQLHGIIQGSKNGLLAASEAWKTAVSPGLPGEEVSPMFATKTNAIPGTLGKVINIPSKGVAAIHSFFKSIRYEQNIQGLAYREAMKEGLKEGTEAFTSRIADLGSNPTEPMMESAVADTLKELYMTPTEYNSAAGALNRFTNSNLAAKIIMPFMKIGSQITRNAFIERTPLGLLTSDVRGKAFYAEGVPAGDMQLAKMSTGVALMGGVSALVLEGLATGDGPTDPAQRAIWLMNHTPNSIQIGNITLKYQGLGHLGMLMRFSANMTETAHGWNEEDGTKLAKSFMEGITRSVLDENFMRGLKDMLDAVYHPEEYGSNYVRQFATNWLPFSVGAGQVARMIDPSQREAHDIFEAAQNKIPFASEGLMPRRDRFGEIIPNGANARYTNDPVVQRMESLQMGVGKLGKKIRGVELTDQQYDDYARLAGRMTKMRLDQYVAIPQTRTLPSEIQIKTMHSIIDSSRDTARNIVMMNNIGIVKQAYQNKVSALKKP